MSGATVSAAGGGGAPPLPCAATITDTAHNDATRASARILMLKVSSM
jgi:hypothetical protein